MGLGQLRGPSWETGTILHCPNQISSAQNPDFKELMAKHGYSHAGLWSILIIAADVKGIRVLFVP
jgi:hypothetical protein